MLFIDGGASGNSCDTGVMEVEEPPAGVSNESPPNAVFRPACFRPGGPDCSEGVEEIDMAVTERLLLPESRTSGPGLGCSPGWSLSFFGEDCFSPEVVEYARSLGQHTGSAGLEVKTQVSDPVLSSTKSYDCKGQIKICLTFFPYIVLCFPAALARFTQKLN